jgi:hypothetical protein
MQRLRWLATLCGALSLTACTSANFDQALARTNQQANTFTQGDLVLAGSASQVAAMEATAANILTEPLTRDNAVRLALLNSPGLQSVLAQHAADAAQAAQSGRIANPVVSFERLVYGNEVELGRSLSFGLLELMTWPQRRTRANAELARQELLLVASVVGQVTQVRQAWVRAVAARQNLAYAAHVQAERTCRRRTGATYAGCRQFTRLQRARQHAFYADATTQWATAHHAVHAAAREALVRLLGLREDHRRQRYGCPSVCPTCQRKRITPQSAARSASRRAVRYSLGASGTADTGSGAGLGKYPQSG